MSAIIKGIQTLVRGSISLVEASFNVFSGTFLLGSIGFEYGGKTVGLLKKITGGETSTTFLREFHRHHRRQVRK